MIDSKTIQLFLREQGLYTGTCDGIIGSNSYKAISVALLEAGIAASTWTPQRLYIGIQQLMFKQSGISDDKIGPIDGYQGPRFDTAFELFQDLQRIVPMWIDDRAQPKVWPAQKDVESYFGNPGHGITTMSLPYPMVLDWNPEEQVKRIQVNKLVAQSVEECLTKIRLHYGLDEIRHLCLDRFGGAFNLRKMTGSQSKWSMHAYGIALDFWPSENKYRWTKDEAKLAQPVYDPFWSIWEQAGWISLGRARDIDFMHIQAARL